jgi:hypothetical protein
MLKFHMSDSNGLFDITIKLKVKYRFCVPAMYLFHILKKS